MGKLFGCARGPAEVWGARVWPQVLGPAGLSFLYMGVWDNGPDLASESEPGLALQSASGNEPPAPLPLI